MARNSAFHVTLCAVVASLTALCLTGCGSSSSTGGSTSPTSIPAVSGASVDSSSSGGGRSSVPDVCAALTAAQATAIVGETYTVATSSAQGSMCSYTSTTSPVPLSITVMQDSGGSTAWTDELANLKTAGTTTPVTIPGVGDRAAASGRILGIQVGSRIIDIDGGDPETTSGGFPKSVSLGKTIIGALH
jgi:hypothetical protein